MQNSTRAAELARGPQPRAVRVGPPTSRDRCGGPTPSAAWASPSTFYRPHTFPQVNSRRWSLGHSGGSTYCSCHTGFSTESTALQSPAYGILSGTALCTGSRLHGSFTSDSLADRTVLATSASPPRLDSLDCPSPKTTPGPLSACEQDAGCECCLPAKGQRAPTGCFRCRHRGPRTEKKPSQSNRGHQASANGGRLYYPRNSPGEQTRPQHESILQKTANVCLITPFLKGHFVALNLAQPCNVYFIRAHACVCGGAGR